MSTVALLNLLLHGPMLFIAVNNDHHMLDFYLLDFTNGLPVRKLPTQRLPGRFHQIIAS